MNRRAAVLIEMVLALALFVAGAAMLTNLNQSVSRSLERSQLQVEATDLARKALAELEAGIITLADLRTMRIRTEPSTDRAERGLDTEDMMQPSHWTLSVRTERSPYAGLTLVELTVMHTPAPGSGAAARDFGDEAFDNANEVRATVRQLMRLREEGEEDSLPDTAPAEANF